MIRLMDQCTSGVIIGCGLGGQIDHGSLREYVFLNGSRGPVLQESVREESEIPTVVAIKSSSVVN